MIKLFSALLIVCICFGCSVSHLNVNDKGGRYLSQCFPLPNCVSSESFMFYNAVDPIELSVAAEDAWPEIKKVLKSLPRTRVISENEHYIHVTCRSMIFQFVDNVELLLNAEENTVSVRSGSFIAIWDVGVNWLRARKIRKMLIQQGIVK